MVSISLKKALTSIIVLSLCLIIATKSQVNVSKAPFLDPDIIHNTFSQFQFNLILNENKNLPVFFVQYSKDFIREKMQTIVKGAFSKQPGISFALFVDCRNLEKNLNNSLNLCSGFDPEKAKQDEKRDLKIAEDERQDKFFVLDLMTPDSSRIKQKGHELSKNHNIQNLRQMNTLINDDFLAKVLRNQIADFVTYIEDSYDMDDFLGKKSQFRNTKKAKLLFFDQNLQAPLFLKKLAARLDGRIKVGVIDNHKLAKKFDVFYDAILLMQYNFTTNAYDTIKLEVQEGNELNSILENENIMRYMKIKKYRDLMLDFEHRESPVYNMSSLSQINQLITHGRIILLQVSSQSDQYDCPELKENAQKYSVMLNYVCFSQDKKHLLEQVGLSLSEEEIYIIDQDLKTARSFNHDIQKFNIYEHLPQTPSRQKISGLGQAQLCLKTAAASKRDPLIYWYNEKQHKNTLRLLEYFNSLPEVTSLIYFCEVYLPNQEVIGKFRLKENSLFSMLNANPHTGQVQKVEFSDALEFVPIKMFLRQLSINQMMKVYHQKLSSGSLVQIKSAEDLTRECYNQECIVALMATTKFRFESQTETLKQLKQQLSESGYNFVWIDGSCHWDIAKQLKLLSKTQKEIHQSYIFYYKEKSNQYSLMTGIQENKYWVKKDVKKWIKNLKDSGQIKKLKFGIDVEDKKCDKKAAALKQDQTPSQTQTNKGNRKKDLKEGQL